MSSEAGADVRAFRRARATEETRMTGQPPARRQSACPSGIAQDLHDVLGLNLVAVLWQLNAAEGLFLTRDEKAAKACVARARTIAAAALREIRCAVEPDCDAEPDSLVECLESVVSTATCGTDVAARFICCDFPPPLSSSVCGQARRIVLEAVTNAVRHAQASTIEVELSCTLSVVTVAVRDDGRGFVVEQTGDEGGFGLRGMKKRASRISAELSVRSVLGSGTEVRLTIPTLSVRAA
jgi:signal transduction histidine kinase